MAIIENFAITVNVDELDDLDGAQEHEQIDLTSDKAWEEGAGESDIGSHVMLSVSASGGMKKDTIVIAKLNSFPEVKVVHKEKCIRFPTRICMSVPHKIMKRSCDIKLLADISYPDVRDDIGDCLKLAVAAGAAAVMGGPAAVAAAFKVALVGCLTAKGVENASRVSVRAYREKECGDWS